MDASGLVYIVDRKKDMILVSGFNVYPNEVEDVARSSRACWNVAAVGVPDEKSGEAVKLFVVRKDPSLTAEELRALLPRESDRLQAAQVHRIPQSNCRRRMSARSCGAHCVMKSEQPRAN